MTPPALAETGILRPGRNCWREEWAHRVAFLIDADAYFSAFRSAASQARRSILIAGWDVHSQLRLSPEPGGAGESLREFLDALVRRRSGLRVDILGWDFPFVYALDREALPLLQFRLRTHRRIRVRLDATHPLGASHHQKIVVIDDAVAFVGGLDLTLQRWDTREHLPEDPRRSTPDGRPYRPFHDVQMAVDGDAAAALGALVRDRWQRATGRTPRRPRRRTDCWPEGVAPDLREVPVAIARTDPLCNEGTECREVEALWVDAIAAARRTIYIENQYLTSRSVGDALEQRLREDDPPEVVIVSPDQCSGWLEEATMGVLRRRLLARLRAADHRHRLRMYAATVRRDPIVCVNVHAKVLIVDDELVRIGSANLNNRSMGLDSECDLAIEARGAPRTRAAIRLLRERLLAEHLGARPEDVRQTIGETGSLVGAIERLGDGERGLIALERVDDLWLDRVIPEGAVVDPEGPIESLSVRRSYLQQGRSGGDLFRLGAAGVSAATFAAAWRRGSARTSAIVGSFTLLLAASWVRRTFLR